MKEARIPRFSAGPEFQRVPRETPPRQGLRLVGPRQRGRGPSQVPWSFPVQFLTLSGVPTASQPWAQGCATRT